MKNCESMYRDDPEAFFDWFYETYKRFVFKEAGKYFSNPSDIEDLTQEVWLSISRRGNQLCTYSTAQQFSYLAATVRNKAISSMRKHHDTISLEDIAPLPSYDTDTILENIDRKITIERFRHIWSTIPASERELLPKYQELRSMRQNALKTYEHITDAGIIICTASHNIAEESANYITPELRTERLSQRK